MSKLYTYKRRMANADETTNLSLKSSDIKLVVALDQLKYFLNVKEGNTEEAQKYLDSIDPGSTSNFPFSFACFGSVLSLELLCLPSPFWAESAVGLPFSC